MGININPSSLVGYKQSINFLGNQTAAPVQNNPAVAESKGDTVTILGKEVSKKKAVAGGIVGAAVLAGVIAAAVYAIRGGSIGAATRHAKAMTNEANQLAETVKQSIDDVQKVFKKASEGGMEGVTIKDGKNGAKVMKDMIDGNARETIIESGLPSKITTYLKNGKQDVITINQGAQTSLFKAGFSEKNGVAKWAKELESTLAGTPQTFSKKVQVKDGIYTAARRLSFDNGNPAVYGEKFKKTADNVITYVKGLTFENGKPAKFVKTYEKLADGAITENGKKTYDGKKWSKAA